MVEMEKEMRMREMGGEVSYSQALLLEILKQRE